MVKYKGKFLDKGKSYEIKKFHYNGFQILCRKDRIEF